MKFPFFNSQASLNRKLSKAASRGEADEVSRLLDQGAQVNARVMGNPPLFRAAYDGGTEGHQKVVAVLLSRGAQIDGRNSCNCTALMGAANRGHLKVAQLLLASGADPHLRGNSHDALGWATISGNKDVIALFAKKKPEETPRVHTAHEVVFRRSLGNRTLEEIFDFSANERITLIRNGEDGPVEAVTRNGFSELEDRARLREAFEACIRQGGHPDKNAVFPGILPKSKPQKGL